jgi:mono/diheme cytochrome c family protein
MKKTNNRLAFVFLTIISLMFAGCGSNSSGPAALNISTTSLPAGTVGTVYSQTLAATGGTSPYTNWVVSSGTLPAGLALAPATGVISGTPTTAATSNFTVSVTDSAATPATVTKALSITVTAAGAALSITTSSPLAAGTVGTAYGPVTLSATGGTPPYTWSIATGSTLPAGLTLTAGVISGTPTTAGTFSSNIMVTDAAAGTATTAFSITVNAATINGVALYNQFCAGCHGALASPTREHIGATVTQINTGIASNAGGMGVFGQAGATPLSQAQIAAISLAMQ